MVCVHDRKRWASVSMRWKADRPWPTATLPSCLCLPKPWTPVPSHTRPRLAAFWDVLPVSSDISQTFPPRLLHTNTPPVFVLDTSSLSSHWRRLLSTYFLIAFVMMPPIPGGESKYTEEDGHNTERRTRRLLKLQLLTQHTFNRERSVLLLRSTELSKKKKTF